MLIVPVSPEAKTMSSDPGPFWLASGVACRRLPGPVSLRFVTVMVAACALPVAARVAPIAIVTPAATFLLVGPRVSACFLCSALRRRCLWLIRCSPLLSRPRGGACQWRLLLQQLQLALQRLRRVAGGVVDHLRLDLGLAGAVQGLALLALGDHRQLHLGRAGHLAGLGLQALALDRHRAGVGQRQDHHLLGGALLLVSLQLAEL